MMEAICTTEISVYFETRQHYIPDGILAAAKT
jgi:hypothetical protein